MIHFQVWIWSSTVVVDMRTNVITAERDTVVIQRSLIKPVAIKTSDKIKPSVVVAEKPAPVAMKVANTANQPSESTVGPFLRSPKKQETSNSLSIADLKNPISQFPFSVPNRHDIVFGYAAAIKYLANYSIPVTSNERLFLFFVCGNEHGQETTWRKICVDASTVVYEVFAKSSAPNRLVTIYAGTQIDWSSSNAFYNDGDLKVKMIPALMEWHGGRPHAKRATSNMMLEETILYEPLVRYLFKTTDRPDLLLRPEMIASKEIVVLQGHAHYREYIQAIATERNVLITIPKGELFFFFISGRLQGNNRYWCPYCRYSEISVEYAFYAFAPPGSRLVKVETTNSYAIWKNPTNEWKSDTTVSLRGVPWMFRATVDTLAHTVSLNRVIERFDHPEAMRSIFQS